MKRVKEIYENYDALSMAAATKIGESLKDSIGVTGSASIALAGGETPRKTYRLLANNNIDWDKVQIFFTDERMVSPDDPQSNYNMVKEELLCRIQIPQKNIHRIFGEEEPLVAAEKYEQELQTFFANATSRFDIILLGVGEEGHTASLFPDTDALLEMEKDSSANFIPKSNAWRITLTFKLINAAKNIFFLVSGSEKAKIVKEILSGENSVLPAAMVREDSVWLLDKDAASQL